MDRLGLLAEIPTEVWQKGWNVNCKAVGDLRLALRYLALLASDQGTAIDKASPRSSLEQRRRI